MYSLVQCTQGLSIRDCFICIQEPDSQLPWCCGGKKGGRVLTPSCNVRFELYLYVNETFISTLALPSASEPPHLPLVPPAPGSVTRSHAPPPTLPSHELDDEGFASKALQHLLLSFAIANSVVWIGLIYGNGS
ncbi:hypothetical protein Patl1_12068 [Pistacia atlantica]|uniref:Uncharacterized protein n=1 Tax=Pistacia atlantica TaxID=434234 RepID=A0ACC1A3H6_9ROSI|nr:hypothetical protein Patl1_12068 [Pistacia atlantica]